MQLELEKFEDVCSWDDASGKKRFLDIKATLRGFLDASDTYEVVLKVVQRCNLLNIRGESNKVHPILSH